MKITAFNGSPHGERGNTNVMVVEFLAGAKDAGAEVESIQLADKKINHCIGCFACWIKTPGECCQDDDQAELLKKFIGSDIVVLATPLYVDNVTGIMKDFFDRLIPLIDPHFAVDEQGETIHVKRYEKFPKFVVISNCGFPEQSHFQVLKLLFRRVARNMMTDVIAEIYRGGGGILNADVSQLKPILDAYKGLLRKAGSEVVKEMKLSDETMSELEKPLLPKELYLEKGNESWDAQLAQFEGSN